MNTASYIFPLFIVNSDGSLLADAGTGFAVAPDGGVLTCRHVVDRQFPADEDRFVAVVDRERNDRVIPVRQVRYSSDAELDLAFLPDALQRSKREFLPILDPERVMMAMEVRAIGYFGHGPGVTDVGAFVGHVVAARPSGESRAFLTLSFPVIEGMSGSPLLTNCGGLKVAGLCFGSRSQRVLAQEIVEVRDGDRHYVESVNRIVEFGLASHASVIVRFLDEVQATGAVITSAPLRDAPFTDLYE